ncbi:MAG TPA: amidohydrolase family protein [Jatrophihabitantaceae bacterium]|jgi:hypothetical protein|nr:amidohydrolase family protein [Jatrophihabitantaceae bacterium]
MLDADIPAWWNALGLPGLVDIHTHFMPEPVMNAVWRYFDNAERHYGMPWPVQYRGSDDERVGILREIGVRHFTSLLYPHKPSMAESLNAWSRDFAARTSDCVQTATFFPESSAARYVPAAIEAGARIFKVHVQVGGYDPRDDLLRPVWGTLAEAAIPVVVHCGSGPAAGLHTGPEPFGAVLAEHPSLPAVIAHMGAPEYLEHLALAERYPNVRLDTTMVATDFMNALAPVTAEVRARMADLSNRIVLGSDFPNIPYAYAEQIDALQRLELGDDWLRAVCWYNGCEVLGVS